MAIPVDGQTYTLRSLVEKRGFKCIWDALGIPAMLKEDARILTTCGCCNDAMTVTIQNGSLVDAAGLIHFAIPPKVWWKNVVFT